MNNSNFVNDIHNLKTSVANNSGGTCCFLRKVTGPNIMVFATRRHFWVCFKTLLILLNGHHSKKKLQLKDLTHTDMFGLISKNTHTKKIYKNRLSRWLTH